MQAIAKGNMTDMQHFNQMLIMPIANNIVSFILLSMLG
jgi:hypothetical protein